MQTRKWTLADLKQVFSQELLELLEFNESEGDPYYRVSFKASGKLPSPLQIRQVISLVIHSYGLLVRSNKMIYFKFPKNITIQDHTSVFEV